MQQVRFDRDGDDLVNGMYVELPVWGWHLFRIEPHTRVPSSSEPLQNPLQDRPTSMEARP